MKRNTVALILLIALIIGVPLGYALAFVKGPMESPSVQASFNATYHPETETLTIRHDGGDKIPTSAGEGEALLVTRGPWANQTEGIVLKTAGTTHNTARWTATSRPRVTTPPVAVGDSVVVVRDGHNSDGDGTAGVEPGDTLRVAVTFADAEVILAKFEITAGQTAYGPGES